MVQDAACKKINNVLVDTSDLAISQYSLLGQTPPPSAPDSPATLCRDSSPAVKDQTQSAGALVDQLHVLDPQHHANTSENLKQDPTSLYPSIVVTEQLNGSPSQKGKTSEEVHLPNDVHQTSAESDIRQEDGDRPEAPVNPVGHEPSPSPPHINAECFQGPSSPELSTSEHLLESFEQQPSASSLVNIRLGFLSQAIAALPGFPAQHQGPTDRAVYLSGEMKDNWEVEKVEKQEEASQTEVQGRRQEEARGTGGGQEKMGESAKGGEMESLGKSVEDIRDSEATERSVATKKEVEEEKKEDKKQEVEEEEDNGKQGECREDKEKETEEEQKAKKDNDRGRGEKHKEDKGQKKESKEEKQMDDGGRGRECKEEKEEKEKVEEQKEKEDDGGGDGEKQEGEEEQKESKEKQEEQKEDGGKGGEYQEEKEKGKKDEDRGRGVKHEEDKEEQKEIEGRGGKDAEEKEEHEEEKKDDDDDGGHKEKQEEQKTESKEEKQQEEIGGRVLEQVVPDCPLGEPQPDSIAAIREMVSEVIEVEVEISPGPELPASCNDAL